MYTLRKCGSRLQVLLEALYARANLPASAELRRPSSEETLEAETETSEKEACGSGPEARGPKREFYSQPPTGIWRSVWSRPQLRPDGTSALWSRPKTTRLLSKTQKGICISSNAAEGMVSQTRKHLRSVHASVKSIAIDAKHSRVPVLPCNSASNLLKYSCFA